MSSPDADSKPGLLVNLEAFSATRCPLGPAWDEAASSLYWVDIHGGTVLRRVWETGEESGWRLNVAPSAAIPTSSCLVVVPGGRAVHWLDTETGGLELAIELTAEPENSRCNDAQCDPSGNLWVGTMDRSQKVSSGSLLRVGAGSVERFESDLGIPNTLAWDSERAVFYFADSPRGVIYVYDYDPESSQISNRRIFFDSGRAPGTPDGSAIDSEGHLWNARWDGGCVVRISPIGKVDHRADLPARRPTSCAFGGPDLKTLFVTSVSVGTQQENGSGVDGLLFCFEVGVAGARVGTCELNC